MNKELKQKIDNAWRPSDFGQWCEALARDDVSSANNIFERIFDSGYIMMSLLEEELADQIAELMQSESDVDEYLMLLEKENSDLVGVLIRVELFYMVSKRLENKGAK